MDALLLRCLTLGAGCWMVLESWLPISSATILLCRYLLFRINIYEHPIRITKSAKINPSVVLIRASNAVSLSSAIRFPRSPQTWPYLFTCKFLGRPSVAITQQRDHVFEIVMLLLYHYNQRRPKNHSHNCDNSNLENRKNHFQRQWSKIISNLLTSFLSPLCTILFTLWCVFNAQNFTRIILDWTNIQTNELSETPTADCLMSILWGQPDLGGGWITSIIVENLNFRTMSAALFINVIARKMKKNIPHIHWFVNPVSIQG